MALDESAAKALAEAVATGTEKVLRFPCWEKDAREVVQMKGLFADATDRAGQMRAALGKLGFEDVPQRAAQWHLCWLLSLWEEKVRTWLKREGVLVEEESSDGKEDTDGEAADGEAAAEEPGVASLLTEMRKEVAALRAELAEAKNGQRPGSAGPGGLAVGLQALKPQAWTTLDGKERAVVYGELARRAPTSRRWASSWGRLERRRPHSTRTRPCGRWRKRFSGVWKWSASGRRPGGRKRKLRPRRGRRTRRPIS
ncbi:hypothetical protein DIPPA_07705 [Diplonema papillatum]|nr:hypothetical protein DIPPA_07705 [Diplonema papillatum]